MNSPKQGQLLSLVFWPEKALVALEPGTRCRMKVWAKLGTVQKAERNVGTDAALQTGRPVPATCHTPK